MTSFSNYAKQSNKRSVEQTLKTLHQRGVELITGRVGSEPRHVPRSAGPFSAVAPNGYGDSKRRLHGMRHLKQALIPSGLDRDLGRDSAHDDPSRQKATCVRIANAPNLAPASPLLVGLICLAMLPCR